MSNVEQRPGEVAGGAAPTGGVEVMEPREVPLGGPRAMRVRRTLPQRSRSLIGAWCFVDHYGPDDVAATGGMSVAPHPHTGLQTVSWLFTGEIEHRDSAGHHAMVRPGELNLMTAGRGISHSEVSTAGTRTLHGAQLWVALPDADRDGEPGFAHHAPQPRSRPRLGGAGLPRLAARRHLAGRDGDAAARRRAAARARRRGSSSTSTRRSSTACWSTPATSLASVGGDVEAKPHELAYVPPGRGRSCWRPCEQPARLLLLGGPAVRRGDRDVVELRGPQPRRDRRRSATQWQAQITVDGTVVATPRTCTTAASASSSATTCRRSPRRRCRTPACASGAEPTVRRRPRAGGGVRLDGAMSGPVIGEDGVARCPWGGAPGVMRDYHDREWGTRVHGEAAYLERLTLEAFQSGLSWSTILNKREAFREVFAGFDAEAVAAYDEDDVARLMADARIVRNRRKIEAASPTPGATVALREDGGLEAFVLVVRARPAAGARDHRGDGHDVAGVDGAVEGAEEARLRVRRPDHDVRADGGDRASSTRTWSAATAAGQGTIGA